MWCTTGSREVPGERETVIKEEDDDGDKDDNRILYKKKTDAIETWHIIKKMLQSDT
jgi:hypothetical protein